jgi:hypothetical protein
MKLQFFEKFDGASDEKRNCTKWRPYCLQLQAQQVISMGYKHVLCMETQLCAAVGTASH